jgi:hypothetical protein
MGLRSYFHSTGEGLKKGFRKGAEGVKWVLNWMWNNPQLAGNVLSLAAQTIPGVDTAVSAGFSAAGKAIDMGKKLTEGTAFSSNVDQAQAKLKIIQKRK